MMNGKLVGLALLLAASAAEAQSQAGLNRATFDGAVQAGL